MGCHGVSGGYCPYVRQRTEVGDMQWQNQSGQKKRTQLSRSRIVMASSAHAWSKLVTPEAVATMLSQDFAEATMAQLLERVHAYLMNADHTCHVAKTQQLAAWIAFLAVLVGALVLVGWTFDVAVLKSVWPGWVAMKANTAICFILIGIALLLIAAPHATLQSQWSNFLPRLARLCVLLAGLIGLLTLCEYLFNWNPGFDQWLFREPDDAVGTSYPGRMAPDAALSFVLLPAALWLSGLRKNRWSILTSVSFCLLVSTLALSGMLSYLTPALGTFGWFGLTIMAMHTAILFALLGLAIIAISWQQDDLPWCLGRNTTAAFACGMAVLVLIGFNASRSHYWMQETSRHTAYSEVVLDNIGDLLIEVIDTQAHIRGYLITGDERFRNNYLIADAGAKQRLRALHQQVAGYPHQQQSLAQMETHVQLAFRWFQQAMAAERNGMTDAARKRMIVDGEALLNQLRIKFDQLEIEHQRHIDQSVVEVGRVSRFSYFIIFFGTLTSLLIFLTVIFRLNFAVYERKLGENILRKLSQAVEQSSNAIVITDLTASIEYVNDAFVRVTGYRRAELLGQNMRILESGKTQQTTYADMWAHLNRGDEWKGELINQRKDGSEFIESLLISPVRQADGRVTNYLAIMEDVTQFRQAQEALRTSREDMHRLLNSMAEAAYGVDTQGVCTFVNRAFLQMLGYQEESEVLGKSVHELIHHSHADGSPYPSSECSVQRAFRSNQIVNVSGEVFWRKDGVAIPVEFWAQPIAIDGVVTGAITTFIDISERMRAVAALRESEEKFSRVFESNPAMIAIGTPEGRMVDVNPAYANFIGFSREDILGKSLADLGVISAAELKRLLELCQGAGDSLRNVEVSLRAGDGRLLTALLSADIVNLGGASYRLATLQDITQRKLAEEEIEFKNTMLLTQQEVSPDAILVVDEHARILSYNQNFIDLWQLSPALVHTRQDALLLQAVAEQVENPQAFYTRIQYLYEHRAEKSSEEIQLKDGRILDRYSAPLNGANGKYYGRVWYFRDITERKGVEVAQKNMLAKFHSLFEMSSDAINLLDEKGFFDCNEAALRLFGCPTRDDFLRKHPADFSPPIQPGGEDSERLANEHMATALKNGNHLFEWIHRRQDGTEFPAEVLLTALELGGKPVLQATVRDISERKQAEARLAEQVDELRRWHEVTLGREGRILDLKHEVNELLGQSGQPPRYPSAEMQPQLKD